MWYITDEMWACCRMAVVATVVVAEAATTAAVAEAATLT